MSRKFKLCRDPYDPDSYLYKKGTIEIKPGVTVLVGCNGIGKTTLLRQIKNRLKCDNVPYIDFDNFHDGGRNSISRAGFLGNMEFMATATCSSEGENIVLNMGDLARDIGDFVRSGKNPRDKLQRDFLKAMGDTTEEDTSKNERWILLDAIDSGLSVDNVVDIKECLFKTILEYNDGNTIYIIVSANAYEMVRGENCFDVYNGKYLKFKDYDDYRQFILDSKGWKERRYEQEEN